MKRIKYLIVGIITLFVFNLDVNAAANLYTSKSTVYKGDSFTTGVSLSGVASWEVHVTSSGPVKNCSINAADATENAANGSKNYSVNCETTGTGTINIKLTGNTTTEDFNNVNISGSKTVSVINKPVTNNTSSNNNKNNTANNNKNNTSNKKKSSINYLSSLEIEGVELSPKFSKDTNEYTAEVENEVKKIKINAKVQDSKSSVSGTGEKSVTEGMNKFNVVVTAENGAKKTYVIKLTVKEADPIKITLNEKVYTVIRKKDDLPSVSTYYDDKIINIEDEEIPAYYSEVTKLLLIGMKDEDGKTNLYIYDENKKTYKLYNEIKFNQIVLYNIDFPKSKIPVNYKKYTETIDEKELTVYKLNKDSKYSLIYGINVETGKENIYKYDKQENTLQIFEREEQKLLEEEIEQYKKLIMIFGGVILVLVLLVTIGFTRKPKNKNVIVKEENMDTEFLTKKELKKIEKENKKLNKKIKNKEEA